MEYFNSWELWFYVFWISIAVGWGISTGVWFFLLTVRITENLTNLKFKKEEV